MGGSCGQMGELKRFGGGGEGLFVLIILETRNM